MPPKKATSKTAASKKRASTASTASTRSKRTRKSTGDDSSASPDASIADEPVTEPEAEIADEPQQQEDSQVTDKEEEAAIAAAVRKSKRWSAVSGSANLEVAYRIDTKDKNKAYKFVCMCQVPFSTGEGDSDDEDDWDDEDEEEQDQDSDKPKRARCDGGKTCLCDKAAADHPDHPWKLTYAGKAKFFAQRTHAGLRDPDRFSMYTHNDHANYGVLELVENLINDFEEAGDNWKEQWAVCEALALFLKTDYAMPMTMCDDGQRVNAAFRLVGRLFLTMLARLDNEGVLKDDAQIKNRELIMALFTSIPHDMKDYGILGDSLQEQLGPAAAKKKWYPHQFDGQIVAWAEKYGIDLVRPENVADAVESAKSVNASLPPSSASKKDPYGWAKALKSYKARYGNGGGTIGGDKLDITAMSSADRKAASYRKKDPLGAKEIKALKEGLVLSFA